MGYGKLEKEYEKKSKHPTTTVHSPRQIVNAALKDGIVGINHKATKKWMR